MAQSRQGSWTGKVLAPRRLSWAGAWGWSPGLEPGSGQPGWSWGLDSWPGAWAGFVRPGADISDKKGRDTVLWAQVLTATIWIALADQSGWRAGCRCGQLQLHG